MRFSSKTYQPPVLLLAVGVFAVVSFLSLSDAQGAEKAKREDLFAKPQVWNVKIELPSGGQESLRKDPKEYVKATVRVNEELVLTNVGIRLKGQTTYQSIDKRPSLTLKFNEFVKGQDLHGRTKVLLNTSLQDPSCIASVVAGDIFRSANVPAPKATFALVELNGRKLGLYSLTEAANKDFLSEYFKKTKGNLYEGDNNDVTDKLEKDSGDESTDQADLKALAAAAKEPDLAQRLKRLSAVLDLDRFIALMAVEALVWHHDGYGMEHNNYRVYSDPGTGQMVFIVHGMDELFEKPDGSLTPEWKGLVARNVYALPDGKRRYNEAVVKIANESFKAQSLTQRVDELAALVRPALDAGTAKAFESAVTGLKERITKRVSYVQQASKALAAEK
jgi:spore coat protein H